MLVRSINAKPLASAPAARGEEKNVHYNGAPLGREMSAPVDVKGAAKEDTRAAQEHEARAALAWLQRAELAPRGIHLDWPTGCSRNPIT